MLEPATSGGSPLSLTFNLNQKKVLPWLPPDLAGSSRLKQAYNDLLSKKRILLKPATSGNHIR